MSNYHNLHNKKILYDDIKNLPNRYDLIKKEDNILTEQINNIINSNKPLLFLPNDIKEGNSWMYYKLILHGITPDGCKTTIQINNIIPYFDVLETKKITEQIVKNYLLDNNIKYKNTTINKGIPFIGYQRKKSKFIRIYFNFLKSRKEGIELFKNLNITTYNNDLSCYYRVVCREYKFNLTSWNKIINYKTLSKNKFTSKYKSTYCLELDIKDIQPYNNYLNETISNIDIELLKLDRTMSLSWDIEADIKDIDAYNNRKDNPNYNRNDDKLFMIGLTIQWINSKKPLLNICLVDKDCSPKDDKLTIICNHEQYVIRAFADMIEKYQPDFIFAFNDSEFDWPMLIEKAQYYNLLPYLAQKLSIRKLLERELQTDSLIKWNYKDEFVKLEADRSRISRNLKFEGYIPFDTRILFQQLYPLDSKSSLNHYLELNNLGSKEDMPINKLFKIYRTGTAEEMTEVAHYCSVDCFKIHELFIKQNIIQDKREMGKLSFTSMFDSLYRANGLRVRNIVISFGIERNIYFNNIINREIEVGKYPGAIVLNPKKGLVKNRYNILEFIKIEKFKITSEEENIIKTIIKNNYEKIYIENNIDFINQNNNISNIFNKYNDYLKNNEQKYPISGLDFSSLYPSLIMAYNLSPEYIVLNNKTLNKLQDNDTNLYKINFKFNNRDIISHSVRHNDDEQKFGLYPFILRDLFNKRKEMKKKLFIYKEKKEHLELNLLSTTELNDNKEYNECLFYLNYYDSKQKALKVFMNTFYGEAGNNKSPFFVLELAGGVTSSGQYNLLLIKDFITKLKCKTYYGDSVTGDTPIIIKNNNIIDVISIEELNWNKNNKKIIYSNDKQIIYDNNTEVYTENGWTKIIKCIRHFTSKDLYRITTHTGSVIVTEDHSLLDKNKHKIKPNECKIGTELLHWKKINLNNKIENLELNLNILDNIDIIENKKENIALVYGFLYKNCNYDNNIIILNNKTNIKIDIFNKCINIFNLFHIDIKLQIIYKYKAIVKGNISKFSNLWRSYFYSNNRKYKKIPNFILNSDNKTKLLFLQGYFLDNKEIKNNIIYNKGQIGSQGLYLLLHSLGYNVSINTRKDNIYELTFTKDNQIINPNIIKKIEYIGKSKDYVYDLETDSHHFAAGIGKMVVHNTDSLYISCPDKYFTEIDKEYYTMKITKLEYNTKLVEKTFIEIDKIKNLVNDVLLKDNQTKYLKMDYEEVLFPVAFLAKKKYYGIPHEGLVNFKPKNLFIRGLEVKKRGVSNLLIKICMNIMWDSMDINNIETLTNLTINKIKYVYNTKWNINDFVKTAVWKPEKNNIKVHTFINRMKLQNISIPEPFERFKYVIIKKYPKNYDLKGRQIPLKIGDQMEFLDIANQNNLNIDLDYYFSKELVGQFARLISYNPTFFEYNEKNEIDEDKSFKNCTKYIQDLSKQYQQNYVDMGPVYKKIYKTVEKHIKKSKNQKMNYINELSQNNIDNSNIGKNISNNIKSNLNKPELKPNTLVINILKNFKKNLNNNKSNYINILYNNFNNSNYSYYNNNINLYNKELNIQENKINEIFNNYNIINNNEINIENLVNFIRKKYNLDNLCQDINNKCNSYDDIIYENDMDLILNDTNLYNNIDDNIINDIYIIINKMYCIINKIILYNCLFDKIKFEYDLKNNIMSKPPNFNKNDFKTFINIDD